MFRIERDSVDYNKAQAFYITIGGSEESQPESGQEAEVQTEPETPRIDPAEQERELLEIRRKTIAEIEAMRQEAARETEKMLEQARTDGQKLIEQAEAQVEEIRNQAHREGYDKGMEAANIKSQEVMMLQRGEVDALLEDINQRNQEFIASLEGRFIDLSLDIARKIVDIELDKDNQVFVGIVRNAVEQIQREGKLVARVSGDDYKRCFSEGLARFTIDNETVPVSIIEEPLMHPGDCVIESEGETINAGVDSQFRHLEKALKDIRS